MPIYDFVCPGCGKKKTDVFTKTWDEIVRCNCAIEMNKIPSRFAAVVFPADGIFLEHVSPTGKRFYSKKEMRQYAKDHDLQLGALE